MVNPGDNVPNTLKAEFGEEALNSLEATEQEKKQLSVWIDELFARGKMVGARVYRIHRASFVSYVASWKVTSKFKFSYIVLPFFLVC